MVSPDSLNAGKSTGSRFPKKTVLCPPKSDSYKPYSGTALPARLRLTGRRAVGYAQEAGKKAFSAARRKRCSRRIIQPDAR